MAFTGAATIKKISDNLFRITGVSLGIGAAGTIALSQNAAASEVDITAPGWEKYDSVGLHGGTVSLAEAVSVTVNDIDVAGTTVEPVVIVKTGTVPTDFLITLTNRDAAATGTLEIYVRYH